MSNNKTESNILTNTSSITNSQNKRIISVVDTDGHELQATYLKRAKGLVKSGRARWDDETTIKLWSARDKNSIKQQAEFWQRNVKSFKDTNGVYSNYSKGFIAFSDLLKSIFSDYKSFETPADDKKNSLDYYHNLTDTLDFFFQIAVVGVLHNEEGHGAYLTINKAELKSVFKSSATFPVSILEKHSFYFIFYKSGIEVAEYKRCDSFRVYYENSNELIEAIDLFAKKVTNATIKLDNAYKRFLFYTADYDKVLFEDSTLKTADYMLESILNTLGNKKEVWRTIAEEALSNPKLKINSHIHPYVNPFWHVKVTHKARTLATFFNQPDKIRVMLPCLEEMASDAVCNGCKMCFGLGEFAENIESISPCNRIIADINTKDDALKLSKLIVERTS